MSLRDLLDRSLDWAPEYRGGLSSHLPMALHALAGLGADEARLQRYFDRYTQRFDGGRGETPPGFADHRAVFAGRIAAQGRDAALRASLPGLLPGVAAAAFHGAIRTAHAVQAGHDGELAAALAYWQVTWQGVPPPGAGREAMDVEDWATVLEAAAASWTPPRGLITAAIDAAGTTAAYATLAGALAIDGRTLIRLHRAMAGLYAATGNFTVLHLVTGTRALRVLVPWLGDAAAALRTAAPAFAAGLLGSGIGGRAPLPAPVPQWPELIARAVAQDDDHVIKLVHACVESDRLDPDPVYRAAAARALG